MASQRSSSVTLQSDRDDSVFTYSPPSWAHKEWEQYYNYPSLSQHPAPGHGMGESHFATLSHPSLGLKRHRPPTPEDTPREPHLENAHSRDSDTSQSHTSTARSPAGHPWQRSAIEETTTPPSLASINSLIGNSGQAPHTPSILSSLGNDGPGYCTSTPGLSSPIGTSFLFPQQVSLPGESPLRYSSQQSPGSTKRSSSSPFSEEESYGSPRCSPTVRYHVDSATMFGDFESPHQGGKAAALPPRPPTKRARREVLPEPRTPPFTQHPSGDSFRSNISESPPFSYSSISPDYPGFTPDTSPSPPLGGTRGKFTFSPRDSLSPSSSQLSPELVSPPVTTFPKDITRKTISERKRFMRESIPDLLPPTSPQLPSEPFSPLGSAFSRCDFKQKTISERKRLMRESIPDWLPPSSSQLPPEPFSPPGPAFPRYDTARKAIRQLTPITEESFTDSLSPSSPQLSPELFSSPVTTFPKDFTRKSISERKRFIRESLPDLLSPRSPQLPQESFNLPGPAYPRYDTARKAVRRLTPISPDLFSPSDTTFPEDFTRKTISERKRFIRESIPDSLPPSSSQLPPEPFSPPGPAFPNYDTARKAIKRLTPITEESFTDSFSPRSSQGSPESPSPLGPAYSRCDITRKTISERKPLKVEEMLGDAEFWQHIKSDDVTCSADTRGDDANIPFSKAGKFKAGKFRHKMSKMSSGLQSISESPELRPGIRAPPTKSTDTVSSLTGKTYQNFIKQQKMAVIMFYSSATGGPVTPNAFSSYSITAARGAKPAFATVDCAKESDLCASEGVPSYPFYKLYSGGYLLNAVKDFGLPNNG